MLSREERARQFLPFEALNGLRYALNKKEAEIECEEKKELSDEQKQEIQNVLEQISISDNVSITVYRNKRYVNITGKIQKIDFKDKYLVVDDISIYFFNIFEIKLV